MTQLILDTTGLNVVLPESIKGGYTAERRPLYDEVTMVTARLVRELLGSVWVVSYQYGYFGDETKNRVISACEKGVREPITCRFLAPDSAGELKSSRFWVTFKYPKFMWSSDGKPLWADFSISLREVKPSD